MAPHGIRVAVIEPGWIPTSVDANAVRPPAATVDSPHHPGEDAFWAAVDRMRSSQAPPDPQLVADGIATVVYDPHSPFRTPVGTDATTVAELLHQTPFEELSATLHDVVGWVDPPVAARS